MFMGSKLIHCSRTSFNLFGIVSDWEWRRCTYYYFRPPILSTSLWWHIILCPWWQTHACTGSRLVIYLENVQTQWVDRDTYLQIKLIDQFCDLNIMNMCVRSHSTRLFFFFKTLLCHQLRRQIRWLF